MNRIIVHPFLFTLYPILYLYSINIDRVPLPEIYRITLLMLLATAALMAILRLLIHSWQRAGLISSLVILLFSTFGYVYTALYDKKIAGIYIFQVNILGAVWAAILILCGWWIWRKLTNPTRISELMNFVSIFLVCLPIFQMGYFEVKQIKAAREPDCSLSQSEHPVKSQSSRTPDIYYISLDEYVRPDILEELFDHDDSDIVQYLKGKGFYVAEGSHSNFSTTQFSLTSSLNFSYLDQGYPQEMWPCKISGEWAYQLIQNNSVRSFLAQDGYQFVTFSTTYSLTDIGDSSQYIHPTGYLNEFERMYLINSASVFWYYPIEGSLFRDNTNNILDNLARLPAGQSNAPRFIFAHIMAAHSPFVFGHDGEAIPPQYFLNLYPPDQNQIEAYQSAYINQVEYINKRMENIIDTLLSTSDPKPIIIIQSDHGSISRLDRLSADHTCLKERMSIINAYYFPDQNYQNLYPSITPVNTFRVIFDQYFGTHFGKLEDQVYFVEEWDQSPEFIQVTGRLNQCPNP